MTEPPANPPRSRPGAGPDRNFPGTDAVVGRRILRPDFAGVGAWVAVAAAVARVDLRRWARQPMAVLAALALPALTAALVSMALGSQPQVSGTVAVVDLDGGPAGRAFVDDALGDPRVAEVLTVHRARSLAQVESLVDGGGADVGVVIPAGLSEGLATEDAPALRVVRDDGPSVTADLAQLVVDSFARQARAEAMAGATGGPSGRPGGNHPPQLAVEVTAPGGRALDAATHYGPAVGLFFLMVALGYAVDAQVTDRHIGVAERLAATPAPAGAVLAARATTALALGALSLGVTAATMQVAFSQSWGPAPTVVALVVAAAFAYAGVAALLAALVRTPGQAQSLAAAVAFLLAMAGGSLSPPGTAAIRLPLAGTLPSTAALDGFALAATERTGVGGVLPVLVTLVFLGALGLVTAPALAPSASSVGGGVAVRQRLGRLGPLRGLGRLWEPG